MSTLENVIPSEAKNPSSCFFKEYLMSADRNKMIKIIQVGIRKLGLAEYEYRTIYEAATGKNSLREMTPREMSRVLAEFGRLGFSSAGPERGEPPARAAGSATLCRTPQARKIRSLWLTLRDLGALRDARESALLSYVKRLTGTERMEWCTPPRLQYVAETLKSWIERVRTERLAAARGPEGHTA
jgi:phage gp16-like protein